MNSRISDDSFSAKGSIMASYDDNDLQVWRESRRELRHGGIESNDIEAQSRVWKSLLENLNKPNINHHTQIPSDVSSSGLTMISGREIIKSQLKYTMKYVSSSLNNVD